MYLVTKEVPKHMPNQSGGRIINISSVLGKLGCLDTQPIAPPNMG
jgi:NAD(P)-dependent dehydrogenase (short-subunit alcohol dehydrogenase family)